MLAKRIIPCLDVKDGRVVKGVRFVELRDAGDPVASAKAYEAQKADELVFLDITASHEGRRTMIDVVRRVAANIFMPFTVGGGIRGIDDIRALLTAGADKVSLNTAAVGKPELVKESSARFGSQCIVVAIDAKAVHSPQSTVHGKNRKWEVYTHGGRIATGLDAVAWAKKAEKLGAGEILLTSMDADGTKDGFDVTLTAAIARAVRIPVIASGGAGQKEHFLEIFKYGFADAALAASVFHYGEMTVGDVKEYLHAKKIPVRV